MLIMNGTRESNIPISFIGDALYGATQTAWIRPWSWFNINANCAGFTSQTSIPGGNRAPVAFYWPMKAGALSCYMKIYGSGGMTGLGNLGLEARAALTGSGGVSSAIGNLTINLIANITASGGITSAEMLAYLFMAADIAGTGDITDAEIEAFGDLLAAIVADGGITDANLVADGTLSADIKGYGSLTPEGIRDAVWNAILADYQSTGSTGKALASAGSAGDPWSGIMASYTDDATFGAWVKKLLSTNKFIALK